MLRKLVEFDGGVLLVEKREKIWVEKFVGLYIRCLSV